MKVLVTGGLGYIGSHTVVELLNQGYSVEVIDNLSNSDIEVIQNIQKITKKTFKFHNKDLTNKTEILKLFQASEKIDAVIHFAAYKFVGESVSNPLKYYENNISSLINLLHAMMENKVDKMIFSSSCTVYGEQSKMPLSEQIEVQKAMSPYGNTKIIGEDILKDLSKSSPLNAILLRYFNPIGAHPSGLIGETPVGTPPNLIPYLTQTASGKRSHLNIFGNDYNTPDGTALRDYVDVVDISRAHVLAMKRLLNSENHEAIEIFNLGAGEGISVLDMVKAFHSATGIQIPFRFQPKRNGDVPAAYANTHKANAVLNWKASIPIEISLKNAWNWEKKLSIEKNKKAA